MLARMSAPVLRQLTRNSSVPMRVSARAMPVRMLSTTVSVRASEDPRPDLDQSLPPGFEKVGNSPDALSAINKLVEVLKKNGVDVANGEKPSMMQLAKLATVQEVREATTKGMFFFFWLDTYTQSWKKFASWA